jgi:hypothetical protein
MRFLNLRITGDVCPMELHIMSHKGINCSQLSAATVLSLAYAQRQDKRCVIRKDMYIRQVKCATIKCKITMH